VNKGGHFRLSRGACIAGTQGASGRQCGRVAEGQAAAGATARGEGGGMTGPAPARGTQRWRAMGGPAARAAAGGGPIRTVERAAGRVTTGKKAGAPKPRPPGPNNHCHQVPAGGAAAAPGRGDSDGSSGSSGGHVAHEHARAIAGGALAKTPPAPFPKSTPARVQLRVRY
jgi:hypothetical protein